MATLTDRWSCPALDAVAEFRILSIKSLYSGYKQPFFQPQTPLDQFGNNIALVESLGLVCQACERADRVPPQVQHNKPVDHNRSTGFL